MAKLNWNKVNQQKLVHKKSYEDISGEISLYQQCIEKQYQLIEKLINQSPKNFKLTKNFFFETQKIISCYQKKC
ncbi:hypothetical protein [Spiroplasma endosymbiont of Megaselia nigra]|uniref:hypothetical protein n=1 Tax=Spiroplasma endosymbiont of Megaselia nigra TaxID=2478537 RepID=UPI000F85FE78|nr:hypothetical protein [Spiroplasma endosymbiont of Megaselia nigra]RUO86547.1 hypothetical protein D9R21_02375 [Spiroplasma endosymbiont of Megaselia nigra]